LETSNAELRDRLAAVEKNNTDIQEDNIKLQQSNAALKLQLEETDATLQTTMQAVLGVSRHVCY
jgi:hypothetical protein